MRGAPLALPTIATAQFKSFFGCGRAVRCLLPLASGRFPTFAFFMDQGADTDPEQLALTDQLFDAALGSFMLLPLALDARVDFLAVVEHRLIPARVRNEWSRLRSKDMSSIRAPASQVSSHVGNAGVGVISLRRAPLSLPTFATSQFKRFFDCGRVVRCMFPLGFGRLMHLVVLYGFQGADTDAE